MPTALLRRLLLWTGLLFVIGGEAGACPHCNIFNYLCPSIRSSSNIVVGVVDSVTENRRNAMVRVEKVLRGTMQVGTVAQFEVYADEDTLGRRFIFADPKVSPPTFELLPETLEWEVGYLTRGLAYSPDWWIYEGHQHLDSIPESLRPRPATAAEAVQAVEGISTVTRESGVRYCVSHRAELVPRLIRQLEQRLGDLAKLENEASIDHRIDGLIKALWSTDPAAARNFFKRDLTGRLSRAPSQMPPEVPSKAGIEARYVRSVLVHGKGSGPDSFHVTVQDRLPKLEGQDLATGIYALAYSGVTEPKALEDAARKVLANNPDRSLAIATGLYLSGAEHARWWEWGKATNQLNLARQFCIRPECADLRQQIENVLSKR